MSSDECTDRRTFLVTWRGGGHRVGIHPVGRLVYDGRYSFDYLDNAHRVVAFRPFPNFPWLDRSYESAALFPFFSARVMDRRRPDYEAFVHALGLPAEASALNVLARNQGARKGDGVAVVEEPKVSPDGSTNYLFVVRGLRFALPDLGHRETALEHLQPRAPLTVRRVNNAVNPYALALETARGDPVGWVPDGLIPYVTAVCEGDAASLAVYRLNGPEQPAHLRLIAQVSGRLPVGFRTLPQLTDAAAADRADASGAPAARGALT